MKMTHFVYHKSGNRTVYHFQNKKESDRAKHNAIYIAQTFGQITHIEIMATNNISNCETIQFPQNYNH